MKTEVDVTLSNTNIWKFRRKTSLLTKLPDNLSDLVQLAITDARAVMQESGYLYMDCWTTTMSPSFLQGSEEICAPCLAGSVILRTMKKAERAPGFYDSDTEKKLCAINEFRLGKLSTALAFMSVTKASQCTTSSTEEILGRMEMPTLLGGVRKPEFELWAEQAMLVVEKLRKVGL